MPPVSPIQTLATHLLATAAVSVASDYVLRRYAALQSLTPPLKEREKGDDKAEVDEVVEPYIENVPWIHRIKWKPLCIIVIVAIAITATNMALIFASFRYVSQHRQNITWLLFCSVSGTFTLEKAIWAATRRPVTVKLERTDGRVYAVYNRTDFTLRKRLQRAIALLITVALLATAYYGHPEVLAVFPAIICFKAVTHWELPTKRISYLVMGFAGYMALCGVCIVGADLFRSKSKPETPKVYVLPSPAVAASMAVFANSFPVMIPGFLAALSLRFDWSCAGEKTVLPPGESTEPYPKLQPFPKPTYNAAMAGLIFSSCALGAAAHYIPLLASDAAGIAVTLPVTTVVTALTAWRTGQFKAWWNYDEVWIKQE